MMVRKITELIVVLFMLTLLPSSSLQARAAETGFRYINPQTGFGAIIDDEEDLLSDSEEALLLNDMLPITEYGNVLFISAYPSGMSSTAYANSLFWDISRGDSALFMIDMYNREISLFTTGKVKNTVSYAYCNSITDNVYRYASKGNYYLCASEAYKQAATLLDGGRIAQPMKVICCILLALIISLLVNYLLVRATSRNAKSTEEVLMQAVAASAAVSAATVAVTKRVRHQSHSGSFSGGGFSGGGSFGGGGGFSGGSHKF